METKQKTGKIKKRKTNTALKPTVAIAASKSIAALFGINKKEVDGLVFQKKVRNEWQ
jgi:hypothetical protein